MFFSVLVFVWILGNNYMKIFSLCLKYTAYFMQLSPTLKSANIGWDGLKLHDQFMVILD